MALPSRPSALFAVLVLAAVCVGWVQESRGQAAPPRPRLDPDLPMKLAPELARATDGFHMEGPAELEMTFGDSDSFRAQVDRFHVLHERMDALRRLFSRHVAEALGTLPRDSRSCPDDAAVPYYRAWLAGRTYEGLGTELEKLYHAIQRLDQLGESAGLPPGYRWKVEQAHAAYRTALVDYSEMRAVMERHLEPELRFRRCQPEALLHAGASQAPGGLATNVPRASVAVTFFIDNRACAGNFHLFLDGKLLGNVAPQQKLAFQTTAGHHTMCLIEPASEAACGEPRTLRVAHIHDGWTLTTHCQR